MSYDQIHKDWEKAADAELSVYLQRPVRDLLADIAQGNYGTYYQIWYALQGRATLDEAAALSLTVLRSNADYLVRYHCAALLLSLFDPFPDFLTPAKLSAHYNYDVARNLAMYEAALKKQGIKEVSR
jgi:hypothetical protein